MLAENVAGHITMGLDEVLSDLEGQGYSARPFVIPACAIGAPHRRDRVWIVAYSNDKRERHELRKVQETHGEVRQRHNNAKLGDTGIREVAPNTKDAGIARRDRQQRDDEGGGRGGALNEGRSRADDGAKDVADTDDTRNRTPKFKAKRGREKIVPRWGEKPQSKFSRQSQDVADTSGNGLQGQWEDRGATGSVGLCGRARSDKVEDIREATKRGELEPCLGGSLDGVSAWLDGSWEDGIPRVSESEKGRAERLKGLGNAVVPQIVEQIGRAIIEAENGI